MQKKTVVISGAVNGVGFALTNVFLDSSYNFSGRAPSTAGLQEAADSLGISDNFFGVAGQSTAQTFAMAIERFGNPSPPRKSTDPARARVTAILIRRLLREVASSRYNHSQKARWPCRSHSY